MPRYYLDVRYPNLVVEDKTGHDFARLEDAVRVAQALLANINLIGPTSGPDWPRVEISDEIGLVATFRRLKSSTTDDFNRPNRLT